MDTERTLNDAVIAEIRGELARTDTLHADFAKTCGWHPMYFSRRMTGQIPWTIEDLELVAKNLGIDLGQLTNPMRR